MYFLLNIKFFHGLPLAQNNQNEILQESRSFKQSILFYPLMLLLKYFLYDFLPHSAHNQRWVRKQKEFKAYPIFISEACVENKK